MTRVSQPSTDLSHPTARQPSDVDTRADGADAAARGAASNLRRVTRGIEDATLEQKGFSPLWRGAVKLATRIPWLANTDAVKNAAREIRYGDFLRADHFTQFVAGLQNTYGDAVTSAVLGVTQLTKSDYLSVTKMREVRELAENQQLIEQNQHVVNRMEMNVWEPKSIHKCGHVAIAMHRGNADGKPLADNARSPNSYISWWPGLSLKPGAQSGSLIGRMANALFGIDNAMVKEPLAKLNYQEDAQAMISRETDDKLSGTVRDAEGKKAGKSEPTLKPRPNQELMGAFWGERAEARISVPFAGENFVRNPASGSATATPIKTTFGVDPHAMATFWEGVRNDPEASFELISTERNCSGMAARALRAAGAGALHPLPEAMFFLDPLTMERYTTELMKEVAALNRKANVVDDTIGKMVVTNLIDVSPPQPENRVGPKDGNPVLSHEQRIAQARDAVSALQPTSRSAVHTLCVALQGCERRPDTFEAKMQQMKTLLSALHERVNGPFDDNINAVVREAYQLYAAIRHDAHAAPA